MNPPAALPETYLTEGCVMPFCKGCGHTQVIRKLNEALLALKLQPSEVCLVTDIGCIGLADGLFAQVHTVHTTHGRSTAFATGIELADSILAGSKLKTIVLIGDGGAMIGLLHLVNAALLNVDVTVLLCNNFLFGMTGGQHSAFSPTGFRTPTTPGGTIVPPLDICRLMADSHASFVGRTTATDHDLAPMLARAIAHTGFSVVEILELCTEHATSRNALTGKALAEIALRHGEELGVIVDNADREEFGKLYAAAGDQGKAEAADPGIQVHYPHALDRPISILLAGSAGERVQSAAGMFCEAAAMCGLQVAQKNDNPVTQGSGFSLSEINLSPEAIDYTGIDSPDVCIIASADGYRELQERDMYNRFSDETIVIVDESLPITEGGCTRLPLRSLCGNTKAAAAGLHHFLTLRGIFPLQAFNAVLQKKAQADEPYLPAAFISLAAKGQKPF